MSPVSDRRDRVTSIQSELALAGLASNQADADTLRYARALEERILELEAQRGPDRERRSGPLPLEPAPSSPFRTTDLRTSEPLGPSQMPIPGEGSSEDGTSPAIRVGSGYSRNDPDTHAASTPSITMLPSLAPSSPNPAAADAATYETGIPPHTQDELVRIFLERVNPRYPFLHEETFIAWYDTWKSSRSLGVPLPPDERWKGFFIKMVSRHPLVASDRGLTLAAGFCGEPSDRPPGIIQRHESFPGRNVLVGLFGAPADGGRRCIPLPCRLWIPYSPVWIRFCMHKPTCFAPCMPCTRHRRRLC